MSDVRYRHPIKFVDLKKNYLSVKKDVDAQIKAVINNTAFILGSYVKRFEENFAEFTGAKYALGVSDGTAALLFILKALGIGPGDEVILPSNTFIATAEAVYNAGAKPVLVDMDSQYNISASEVEKALTKKTKAVIGVHLYGNPFDIAALKKITAKHKIYLIEDACQSHGAEYKGKKTGTFGIAAAYSFYPGKNLGGFGDGGMVVTNSRKIYDYIEKLRDHGSIRKYAHFFPGFTGRLDAIQAAVLNVKLQKLFGWNEARRKSAALYRKYLKDLPVSLPSENKDGKSVYHLFVIQCEKRDELKKFLYESGVETGIHYPMPIHRMPAFSYLKYKPSKFPLIEKSFQKILSLPIYPELKEKEIKYIASKIKEFYKKGSLLRNNSEGTKV